MDIDRYRQMDIDKNKIKENGFTYIEVLISMAILTIILVPILSALSQASANYQLALDRRLAQGLAVSLASKARADSAGIYDLVNRTADSIGTDSIHSNSTSSTDSTDSDNKFLFRVSLVSVGGTGGGTVTREYIGGNMELIESIPMFVRPNFQSAFGNYLFDGSTIVVAEVFCARGNLAGVSYGKVSFGYADE